MRLYKLIPRIAASLLLLLIVSSAAPARAMENPWGHTRILGYKDPIPANCARKFTPFAVLQDVPHAKDLNLYLEYVYARVWSDLRLWKLWVTDGKGNKINTSHDIVAVLPYPSIWSAAEGTYWKWTKNYASRYDWYYSKGESSIHYNRYADGRLRTASVSFRGEEYRPVQPMNAYGFEIYMGSGMGMKSVLVKFVDAGGDPGKPMSTYNEDDEDDEEDEDDDW